MIELRELSKTFYSSKKNIGAVKDLSLSIEKGKVVAFLGPNGAGKTTTIKMICGLITPDMGEITIDGIKLNQNRRDYLNKIGVVLEGARNIYWRLTPYENMEYFCRIRGKPPKFFKERIFCYLEKLNLNVYRNIECRFLSRGNQQKVALACALALDAPVLLLDEPTLGLDIQIAQKMMSVVREEKNRNKTIIITTHDMEFVENVAEKIVVINTGQIEKITTPEQMKREYGDKTNRLSSAYLNLLNGKGENG